MTDSIRLQIKSALHGVEAAEQLCSADLLDEVHDLELGEARRRLRHLLERLDAEDRQRTGIDVAARLKAAE
jgi:hypothetical protein